MFFRCILLTLICGCNILSSFSQVQNTGKYYSILLDSANKKSVLQSDDYYTWGASPIKGNDGLYHLYYSRWKKEYGFLAWVTHSEIAHAVSKEAKGPYYFSDLALPARGATYWDGLNTHNPTIHFFNGKYYLYYTGNTGDGQSQDNSQADSLSQAQPVGAEQEQSGKIGSDGEVLYPVLERDISSHSTDCACHSCRLQYLYDGIFSCAGNRRRYCSWFAEQERETYSKTYTGSS